MKKTKRNVAVIVVLLFVRDRTRIRVYRAF